MYEYQLKWNNISCVATAAAAVAASTATKTAQRNATPNSILCCLSCSANQWIISLNNFRLSFVFRWMCLPYSFGWPLFFLLIFIAVLHFITISRHQRRKNRSSTSNAVKCRENKKRIIHAYWTRTKEWRYAVSLPVTLYLWLWWGFFLRSKEVLQHHVYTMAMLELAQCTTNFSEFFAAAVVVVRFILSHFVLTCMFIWFSAATFFVN